jgi:carbon starvation protein
MSTELDEERGEIRKIRNDPDRPPVAVEEPFPLTNKGKAIFGVIGLIGAIAWAVIAFIRGESVNAVWFVLAAVATYIIAFRFYARLIEYKVLKPRDTRMTPAEEFANGKDFMPTDRRILFGHHFAAVAGAGPLVGPVLAAQMGYLPGTIWIIIGVVFAGAVQDYMVSASSGRTSGPSRSATRRRAAAERKRAAAECSRDAAPHSPAVRRASWMARAAGAAVSDPVPP